MKLTNMMCLIIIIFLIGCKDSGNSEIEKEQIYTGTKGLDIEIIEESYPNEVNEKEEFNVVIKLTNYGAYPFSPGNSVFTLSTEKKYMEFSGGNNIESKQINLNGKQNFNSDDDFQVLEYTLKAKELDIESQYHTVKVIANACYDYQTKVYADVCIDTDKYNTKIIDKVCSSEPVTLSGGQGGPVAVTRIEPTMLSDKNNIKPQFRIYIENLDYGSVIKQGTYNTICSSNSPQRNDYNQIELTDIKFSRFTLNDFDCEPEINGRFFAKLENEQDVVTCTLKNGISKATATYTTPLYIQLDYGYTTTDFIEIMIKNLS
ncbi:hypothetical protein GF327_03350 [Candidatus Woesearchaeota archaeon]|nr:hypothetical protein [Candidatus Woesearchaeota archaeon]